MPYWSSIQKKTNLLKIMPDKSSHFYTYLGDRVASFLEKIMRGSFSIFINENFLFKTN